MAFLLNLSPSSQALLVFCFFTAISTMVCVWASRDFKKKWIRAGRPTQAEAPEHTDWRVWRNHGYSIGFTTIVLIFIALGMPAK
jgi:hypothetical protein